MGWHLQEGLAGWAAAVQRHMDAWHTARGTRQHEEPCMVGLLTLFQASTPWFELVSLHFSGR